MSVAPHTLPIQPMRRAPATEDTIIFQLAMPAQMRMRAPSMMAMKDVSPMEPGMVPMMVSMAS